MSSRVNKNARNLIRDTLWTVNLLVESCTPMNKKDSQKVSTCEDSNPRHYDTLYV